MTDTTSSGTPGASSRRRHAAGIFDIRNIIGGLITTYGVILTLMGLFGDAETDKTGGVNANLWAGLVMLVVGIGFLVWARVRPVMVPENTDSDDADRLRQENAG